MQKKSFDSTSFSVSITQKSSRLYAPRYFQPTSNYTAECVFMEEMLENYYNLYSSCAHGSRRRPWYVALRRTGRVRRGRYTKRRQKSSHFLVIHFDADAGEEGASVAGTPAVIKLSFFFGRHWRLKSIIFI